MPLFILHHERSFLELATTLAPHDFVPEHVKSSTFPGRPEPRSAHFVYTKGAVHGAPALIYRYLPDLEVRALLQERSPLPGVTSPHIGLEDLLAATDTTPDAGPWFERWSVLRQELYEPAHQRAQRAAACWVLRGQWASTGDAEAQKLCLEVLCEGLLEGTLSARRACAEQLKTWPMKEAREALESAYQHDQDVEVRLHARQALERLDVASMLR